MDAKYCFNYKDVISNLGSLNNIISERETNGLDQVLVREKKIVLTSEKHFCPIEHPNVIFLVSRGVYRYYDVC